MKRKLPLLAISLFFLALPCVLNAGSPPRQQEADLSDADRKVEAGRLLLKWGGYVEKVLGQDRRVWAASFWPALAQAHPNNLRQAARATTYEGMRNAVLGRRPNDEQIIDHLARTGSAKSAKAFAALAQDLVYTPITPCRIADTRVTGTPIAAGGIRDLNAANPGGNFTSQGGSASDCGIPLDPGALALSVTALGNTNTGYLRVYINNGSNLQGSPVPLSSVNTTATNDIIAPACASISCAQELRVYSTANTHYAVFAIGYFAPRQRTQAQCFDSDSPEELVMVGESLSVRSSCPAGYTLVGGGCSGGDNLNLHTSKILGNEYLCGWFNAASTFQKGYAQARCCDLPGR